MREAINQPPLGSGGFANVYSLPPPLDDYVLRVNKETDLASQLDNPGALKPLNNIFLGPNVGQPLCMLQEPSGNVACFIARKQDGEALDVLLENAENTQTDKTKARNALAKRMVEPLKSSPNRFRYNQSLYELFMTAAFISRYPQGVEHRDFSLKNILLDKDSNLGFVDVVQTDFSGDYSQKNDVGYQAKSLRERTMQDAAGVAELRNSIEGRLKTKKEIWQEPESIRDLFISVLNAQDKAVYHFLHDDKFPKDWKGFTPVRKPLDIPLSAQPAQLKQQLDLLAKEAKCKPMQFEQMPEAPKPEYTVKDAIEKSLKGTPLGEGTSAQIYAMTDEFSDYVLRVNKHRFPDLLNSTTSLTTPYMLFHGPNVSQPLMQRKGSSTELDFTIMPRQRGENLAMLMRGASPRSISPERVAQLADRIMQNPQTLDHMFEDMALLASFPSADIDSDIKLDNLMLTDDNQLRIVDSVQRGMFEEPFHREMLKQKPLAERQQEKRPEALRRLRSEMQLLISFLPYATPEQKQKKAEFMARADEAYNVGLSVYHQEFPHADRPWKGFEKVDKTEAVAMDAPAHTLKLQLDALRDKTIVAR